MLPEDLSRRRFEEIYTAHYPDILAYVRRRTGSPDDAADALAETFTVAWRRVAEIPADGRARLWLYGVARRVLANGRRAESRRSELVERLGAQLAVWSESIGPPGGDDLDGVRKAFGRLSPDDREVLSLAGWEGLDSEEIATVLGCSRGAVRLRLHRARKRLAAELRAAGFDVAVYGPRALALTRDIKGMAS
ncbi:DNA-directed RNA polymerase sigma-70 factor [Sphaerisporangium siamense]|uniref:RNA polymerase sigma-70 factor (ECF subfamily) n=1 Tax=Sphaerisporangium siamense TaxID=795645 RepID=A0A7W7GA18_9ACTN|nr:RNA polymerase sigma factor [Sphaerisporangium siamense]MBB4701245.1 RNA polymerase sigma-70 factor (ECF subfamily) [Sphaerisporangium siamense]GII87387.1 DNA-directed RNA polymerase sigma-70 factor [Sphaerisporangium siamense]